MKLIWVDLILIIPAILVIILCLTVGYHGGREDEATQHMCLEERLEREADEKYREEHGLDFYGNPLVYPGGARAPPDCDNCYGWSPDICGGNCPEKPE